MGRTKAVHPGPDGAVRVAAVRAADGVITRPVVISVLLPVENNSSS